MGAARRSGYGERSVKNWYFNEDIKRHTKNAWNNESINRPYVWDLRDAEEAVLRRSESIGGHIDKFMAKNGRKIASDLNSYSDAATNTVAKAKRFVTNLFRK